MVIDRIEDKKVKVVTRICSILFNMIWTVPALLILRLLLPDGTVLKYLRFAIYLICFISLWGFVIKVFIVENYVFIGKGSWHDENKDWRLISAIRYIIMLILCGIMIWINMKVVKPTDLLNEL